MNVFKAILYSWQEDEVALPPHAQWATLQGGIGQVNALIAKIDAEKVQAEAARLAARQNEPSRAIDPWSRAKTSSSFDSKAYEAELLESMHCMVPDGKRRVPNLKAATLSFPALLLKHIKARYGGKAPVVYKRSGIDRRLYSKIVADDRSQVSKKTALQLAIGLRLDLHDAEEFLKAAGYSFSPTIPTDCVFAYCIEHGIWNIFDVNRIMVEAGLPALDITI